MLVHLQDLDQLHLTRLVLHVDRPVSPIQAHGSPPLELALQRFVVKAFAFAHLPNSALLNQRDPNPELAGNDLWHTPQLLVYFLAPVNPGSSPQPTATSSNCQDPFGNRSWFPWRIPRQEVTAPRSAAPGSWWFSRCHGRRRGGRSLARAASA